MSSRFTRVVSTAVLIAVSINGVAGAESQNRRSSYFTAPIVVAGATGRTGALIYNRLKGAKIPVRAFVRSQDKAKKVLDCGDCTEKDGIFVGDITNPDEHTMDKLMYNSSSLVVATSASPQCNPFPNCTYPAGQYPIDVDWKGGKNLIEKWGQVHRKGNGGFHDWKVVLISTMGTTTPDGMIDMLDHGHISFYKLNLETFLASSAMPYVIIKPCGLQDKDINQKEIVIGHHDKLNPKPPTIARDDIARVVIASLMKSGFDNIRMDVCGKKSENPTTDDELKNKVLETARWPWDPRKKSLLLEKADSKKDDESTEAEIFM